MDITQALEGAYALVRTGKKGEGQRYRVGPDRDEIFLNQ